MNIIKTTLLIICILGIFWVVGQLEQRSNEQSAVEYIVWMLEDKPLGYMEHLDDLYLYDANSHCWGTPPDSLKFDRASSKLLWCLDWEVDKEPGLSALSFWTARTPCASWDALCAFLRK